MTRNASVTARCHLRAAPPGRPGFSVYRALSPMPSSGSAVHACRARPDARAYFLSSFSGSTKRARLKETYTPIALSDRDQDSDPTVQRSLLKLKWRNIIKVKSAQRRGGIAAILSKQAALSSCSSSCTGLDTTSSAGLTTANVWPSLLRNFGFTEYLMPASRQLSRTLLAFLS